MIDKNAWIAGNYPSYAKVANPKTTTMRGPDARKLYEYLNGLKGSAATEDIPDHIKKIIMRNLKKKPNIAMGI